MNTLIKIFAFALSFALLGGSSFVIYDEVAKRTAEENEPEFRKAVLICQERESIELTDVYIEEGAIVGTIKGTHTTITAGFCGCYLETIYGDLINVSND